MRSLKFTILITLLSLQAVFSFQEAKANPLNEMEIKKHLTGKKFKFTKYWAGIPIAKGVVHYKSAGRVQLQINGQDKVSGKWWLNGDSYCTKYNTKIQTIGLK